MLITETSGKNTTGKSTKRNKSSTGINRAVAKKEGEKDIQMELEPPSLKENEEWT